MSAYEGYGMRKGLRKRPGGVARGHVHVVRVEVWPVWAAAAKAAGAGCRQRRPRDRADLCMLRLPCLIIPSVCPPWWGEERTAHGVLASHALQYGMAAHMRRAIDYGATKEELCEAIKAAAVPGGGVAYSVGVRALQALEQAGAVPPSSPPAAARRRRGNATSQPSAPPPVPRRRGNAATR